MTRHLRRLLPICAAILIGLLDSAVGQVHDPILISEGEGGFTFDLDEGTGFIHERFGLSITTIVDLDGDGRREIAVNTGGISPYVYILSLDENGVKQDFRVEITKEVFGRDRERSPFAILDVFEDVDQDGLDDVLVGMDSTIWAASMSPDGEFTSARKVYTYDDACSACGIYDVKSLRDAGQTEGLPFAVASHRNDALKYLFWTEDRLQPRSYRFDATDLAPTFGWTSQDLGRAMTFLGDVNNDGYNDIAVGQHDGDCEPIGGCPWGMIWILFPKPVIGPVSSEDSVRILLPHSVIRNRLAPMGDVTAQNSEFGAHIAALGDLDGNGVWDLAAPVFSERPDGDRRTWILFLNESGGIDWKGWVPSYFTPLTRATNNGGLAVIDDINNDGAPELVYGDPHYMSHGAIWISFDLADVRPQITPEIGEYAEFDEPVKISANIRGTVGVQSAKVSFRPAGSATFFSAAMTKLGNSVFSSELPAFFLGDGGFQYFISTDSPEGRYPESGYESLPTRHSDGLALPITDRTGSDYELISVPMVLDSASARFNLEDDLGAHDIAEWRLFELDEGVWHELGGPDDIRIEPGKGLALRRSESNRLVRTEAGRTVDTDESYLIRLQEGWNLVGNPFLFDIPLGKLSLQSGAAVELWAYDSTWVPETLSIKPFTAYAIFHEGENNFDTLWVDPDLSDIGSQNADVERQPPSAEKVAELVALMTALKSGNGGNGNDLPTSTILRSSAYPNPFTTRTSIRFELAQDGRVRFLIVDVLGRPVWRLNAGDLRAGVHEIVWDGKRASGTPLSSGTYLYRLEAGGEVRSGKLVRLE